MRPPTRALPAGVEKEAAPRTIETYRWCFKDYESFVMKQIGGTVLVAHFTAETCRAYQYDLAARGLQTSSIRVRLATLGSFGKWAVRRRVDAATPQGTAAAGPTVGHGGASARAVY